MVDQASKKSKKKLSLRERELLELKVLTNERMSAASIISRAKGYDDIDAAFDVAGLLGKKIDEYDRSPVSQIEEILLTQVYALQAIFENAALQIKGAKQWAGLQNWSVIAFKSQEQCRKTLATLANIRTPKQTSFIKQQNNAVNQQILNNEANGKIEKNLNPSNELLNELIGETSYEKLDIGRKGEAIVINSQVETMAKIDRCEK